jgi:hypothetical protein
VRIFEQILLQTRQKFAGILGVWQEFLTQYAAKFAEKTQADAYAHKLSDSTASDGAVQMLPVLYKVLQKMSTRSVCKVARRSLCGIAQIFPPALDTLPAP